MKKEKQNRTQDFGQTVKYNEFFSKNLSSIIGRLFFRVFIIFIAAEVLLYYALMYLPLYDAGQYFRIFYFILNFIAIYIIVLHFSTYSLKKYFESIGISNSYKGLSLINKKKAFTPVSAYVLLIVLVYQISLFWAFVIAVFFIYVPYSAIIHGTNISEIFKQNFEIFKLKRNNFPVSVSLIFAVLVPIFGYIIFSFIFPGFYRFFAFDFMMQRIYFLVFVFVKLVFFTYMIIIAGLIYFPYLKDYQVKSFFTSATPLKGENIMEKRNKERKGIFSLKEEKQTKKKEKNRPKRDKKNRFLDTEEHNRFADDNFKF